MRHLTRIHSSFFLGDNRRNWAPLRAYIEEHEFVAALGAFSDSIFASLLQSQGKQRYVDHTPWYVNLIEFIDLLYPDAQFVHVIRDGRRVVESLSKSYSNGFSWAGATVTDRTELWLNSVERGRTAGLPLGKDRYRELRYEDLCRHPQPTLEVLLGYLDLPMEPEVLRPLTYSHASPNRRPHPVLAEVTRQGNIRLLPKVPDQSWPASWTANEQEEFSKVGLQLLRNLGYQ